MPRVVPDQKDKFENDELFRKLSHDSEVRYIGQKDRSLQEKRANLIEDCRRKRLEITFVSCGITLQLLFKNVSENLSQSDVDSIVLDFSNHKIRMSGSFILNGVCVIFKGWLDTNLLEGLGHIEFDYETARVEDGLLQQHQQPLRCYSNVVQATRDNLEHQFPPFALQSPLSFQHISRIPVRDSQFQAPLEIPFHSFRQNVNLANTGNEPTPKFSRNAFGRTSPTASHSHQSSSSSSSSSSSPPPPPSSSPPSSLPPSLTSPLSSSVPVDLQYKQHWKKRIRPNSEPLISRIEQKSVQLPHANICSSKSLPVETSEKLSSDQETPALDLSMSSKTHRSDLFSSSFERRHVKNDNALQMLTNLTSLPLSVIEESPPAVEASVRGEADTTQRQRLDKQRAATEYSHLFGPNCFYFPQEHQYRISPTHIDHEIDMTTSQHRRQSIPDELTVNASMMSLQYHEGLNVLQSSKKSDFAGQKGN